MHVGLVMECDYREGRTQEEAFAEALSVADLAEASGIDGVIIDWYGTQGTNGDIRIPASPVTSLLGKASSTASVPSK